MSAYDKVKAELIAKGKAQVARFVGGLGAVSRIQAADGYGLIITKIRLHAFADLPAGQNFTSTADVAATTWHQLTVFTRNGQQQFQTRHELMFESNLRLLLPVGWTDWDVWINAQDFAFFSLSHVPPKAGWAITVGQVPGNQILPNPPANYGKDPAGINTIIHVRWTAAGQFQARPLGVVTPPTLTVPYLQNQWQIENGVTSLNPGQPGIVFGERTFPILEVDYLIIKGTPDETYQNVIG